MKTCTKRWTAVFLTLCLLAGLLSAPASAAETHMTASFSSLKAELLDLTPMKKEIAAIIALAANSSNITEVATRTNALGSYLSSAETSEVLYMIAYYKDTSSTEAKENMQKSSEIYTEASNLMLQCYRDLLNTACSALITNSFSDEELASLKGGVNDAYNDMDSTVTDYTTKYYALLAADYGDDDAAHQQALAVGKMYLDEIAALKSETTGGSTVAQMYYAAYGRDYDPDDVSTLREAVISEIVPAYLRVLSLELADSSTVTDADTALSAIRAVAATHFSFLTPSLDFMIGGGYYTLDKTASTADMGFTTMLSDYNAPYLFFPMEGTQSDYSALAHELGHYYDYYEYGVNAGVDASEVHSQALELLFTKYDQELFGNNYSEGMELEELGDCLSSLIFGCLMDEFQQEAFENTPTDAQGLCDLYQSLMVKYGLGILLGDDQTDYFWVQVHHNFTEPFYYISYAMSMAPALELWADAQTDEADAVSTYRTFVSDSNDESFEDALANSGLSDPLTADAIDDIADTVTDYADKIGDWAFTDISNTWGSFYIQWMYSAGAVNGNGDGTYSPNGTLTRAQMAAVLQNLAGWDAGSVEISDISAGSWAYSPASAAVEHGYFSLDAEGNFEPNRQVTRAEMAKILAIILKKNSVKSGTGVTFADSASIPSSDKTAVAAVSSLGIMTGEPGNRFDPDDSLTRAELATVLYRLFEVIHS